jgi:Raf kinase inhibitor-like YbhB/YbcL family protein
MELTSTEFSQNGELPSQYTCDGDGINPPLAIRGVPAGTKSLALVVDDPDAPGGLFVHWVLTDIPPQTQEIAGGSVPDGAIEGPTTMGQPGYVPPCPPAGVHHYRFTLTALDTSFLADAPLSAPELVRRMEGHVLAQTQLVALYRRS